MTCPLLTKALQVLSYGSKTDMVPFDDDFIGNKKAVAYEVSSSLIQCVSIITLLMVFSVEFRIVFLPLLLEQQ
jgi:hypothetical protein